jgi:hypothetical protein
MVLLGGLAPTTSLLSTTSPPTITSGQSVTLTLNVSATTGAFSAPTGIATLSDGGAILGTAGQTSSPYTFVAANLGSGSHTLTASYAGNARSSSSTSNSIAIQVIEVNLLQQTITIEIPSTATLPGSALKLSATASSGLPVSFASATMSVCAVSASTVTPLIVGTCTITASQAGNADYAPAPSVSVSFAVNLGTQKITFAALKTVTLGINPFTISATASSGLPVSFTSTTTAVCTLLGATVTVVDSGTCSIIASQAGNANYAAATPVSNSFIVVPHVRTRSLLFNHSRSSAGQ